MMRYAEGDFFDVTWGTSTPDPELLRRVFDGIFVIKPDFAARSPPRRLPDGDYI